MPRSLLPGRRTPESAPQYLFPDRCPAATHRPEVKFHAVRAKSCARHHGQNSQWCCPKREPTGDPLPCDGPPPREALRGTAARNRRHLPDRSAPSLFHTQPKPRAKSRLGSNKFSGAETALPESSAFFFRCRCPAPPLEAAKATDSRSRAHDFEAVAHPRVSGRIRAAHKWPRTAPSPLHRTNTSTVALAVRSWLIPRALPRRIPIRVELIGFESA